MNALFSLLLALSASEAEAKEVQIGQVCPPSGSCLRILDIDAEILDWLWLQREDAELASTGGLAYVELTLVLDAGAVDFVIDGVRYTLADATFVNRNVYTFYVPVNSLTQDMTVSAMNVGTTTAAFSLFAEGVSAIPE